MMIMIMVVNLIMILTMIMIIILAEFDHMSPTSKFLKKFGHSEKKKNLLDHHLGVRSFDVMIIHPNMGLSTHSATGVSTF